MRLKFNIEQYRKKKLPGGYLEEIIASAEKLENGIGYIDFQKLELIRTKYGRSGMGDVVEKLARPIAKALRLKCHDENGSLKPESPCAKRKSRLNGV